MCIERPDFYKVTLRAELGAGAAGKPAFLAKLIEDKNVETLTYIITMEAKFERLAAENPDMIEAKEWASFFFAGMTRSMADPGT